jgi:hypothetical protein
MARVSVLAASSAFKTGLASSRYQSQNTFQTKRYKRAGGIVERRLDGLGDLARRP